MIIITATVSVRTEHLADAVELSRRHVAASRLEDGCLSHRFFIDLEHDRTLVFLETWKDQAAIDHHFAQPYSLEFARSFKAWGEGSVGLEIHRVADTRALTL